MPIAPLATTMDITLSRTHYTLARCGCGQLLYLSPPPTASDLHAMYVDQNQFGEEYTDETRATRIVRYMSQSLDRIAAMRGWPHARALRILEVGAGLSWMCRAAKRRNPACVTVAQDVSPEAVARCGWVDHYVQGEVTDARLESPAPYDVISMTHVIEHLVDPVSALQRCLALLGRDGVIFITAPYRPRGWRDESPDIAKWIGYSYNHVPAHIQYFSEGSMRRLAGAVGARLIHWSHHHDAGQAFEAWVAAEPASTVEGHVQRLLRVFRRRPAPQGPGGSRHTAHPDRAQLTFQVTGRLAREAPLHPHRVGLPHGLAITECLRINFLLRKIACILRCGKRHTAATCF